MLTHRFIMRSSSDDDSDGYEGKGGKIQQRVASATSDAKSSSASGASVFPSDLSQNIGAKSNAYSPSQGPPTRNVVCVLDARIT
jgi:hypothetical protein